MLANLRYAISHLTNGTVLQHGVHTIYIPVVHTCTSYNFSGRHSTKLYRLQALSRSKYHPYTLHLIVHSGYHIYTETRTVHSQKNKLTVTKI